jgi:Tol biopolymer transport system component
MVVVIAAARRLNRNTPVPARNPPAGEVATPNPNVHYEQITSYGNVVSAALSPDAKQVAYIQENPGQQSIWLVQLATHIHVQVIPPSNIAYRQITFSHDGDYIFFARYEENQPSALYHIPTLKGPAIKLLEDMDGPFSLSSDDHKVVFRRRNRITREDGLYIADLDSGHERALVTSNGPDWIRAFSLSPDGKKVVFATGETDSSRQTIKISEVDVETGQARLLLEPNWYAVRQLEFLPSGDGLLICARESATTNPQFWRMSYPGGALRKLTNDLNNYLCFSMSADASAMIAVESTLASHIWIAPNITGNKAKNVADGRGTIVWTTDGKIVYNAASLTGTDLWIANSDGTDPKQLSFNSGYNDWPSLSPDNRIVFHSNRTGAQHLFRMDRDGSNLVQLTNGYAERNAAVSPDGKWVYYNSSESSFLWKVPLDGGEPIQLIKEYAAYPSVSPDGKLVACFHFPKYEHEAQITIRSTDDMRVVSELTLAPGLWISRSIRWEPDSATVIYANQSKEKIKVYRQSIYSGAPQELTTVKAEDEFEFSFSPDRRQLAYVSTKWNHDAVLIDGFK